MKVPVTVCDHGTPLQRVTVVALDERRIGDVVRLTIERAFREREVSVTLQRER